MRGAQHEGNARYDAFASCYDGQVGELDDDLVAASLLGLIGDVKGQRILDLGCGQGRISRELARLGNDVVGVDLSAELLRIAMSDDQDRVEYFRADACKTDWWDGIPFDGVVSSGALMDMDDLDGAASTAAAISQPGGWFVWSILHPCFPGNGESRSSWPTTGGYFDEVWSHSGGPGVRGRVGANHRALSTYFNVMIKHAFTLEAVVEQAGVRGDIDLHLLTRWHRPERQR